MGRHPVRAHGLRLPPVLVRRGARLGHALPRSLATPVAAVIPYATYAILAIYATDGPLGVLAVGDSRVYDYVRPTTESLVARLLFWLLACSPWLLHLRIRRRVTAVRIALSSGAALTSSSDHRRSHSRGGTPDLLDCSDHL